MKREKDQPVYLKAIADRIFLRKRIGGGIPAPPWTASCERERPRPDAPITRLVLRRIGDEHDVIAEFPRGTFSGEFDEHTAVFVAEARNAWESMVADGEALVDAVTRMETWADRQMEVADAKAKDDAPASAYEHWRDGMAVYRMLDMVLRDGAFRRSRRALNCPGTASAGDVEEALYAIENDQLRAKLRERDEEIARLRGEVGSLRTINALHTDTQGPLNAAYGRAYADREDLVTRIAGLSRAPSEAAWREHVAAGGVWLLVTREGLLDPTVTYRDLEPGERLLAFDGNGSIVRAPGATGEDVKDLFGDLFGLRARLVQTEQELAVTERLFSEALEAKKAAEVEKDNALRDVRGTNATPSQSAREAHLAAKGRFLIVADDGTLSMPCAEFQVRPGERLLAFDAKGQITSPLAALGKLIESEKRKQGSEKGGMKP